MKTTKVFKTKNNTILIVTADTNGKYVSVTANEIEPIKKQDAIDQNREYLEDGELWKMSVQSGKTYLGLNDWVEMVINNDGDLCFFDNSLYTNEISVNEVDYLFDSRSCGCLHDDIKEVTNEFDTLIDLHLSDNIMKADAIIDSIKSDNVDELVEIYTYEILGLEFATEI